MKIKNILSLLSVAALLGASQAWALSYNANVDGVTAPTGVTFTGYTGAAESNLGLKTIDGYTNLGVVGGKAGNEIDIGQSLEIVFAKPVHVTSLTLGLLFDGKEYGDFKETAIAQILNSATTYALTATGSTSSLWTGSGWVVNKAPAKAGKGAVWEITNPFGDMAVSGFVLYPKNSEWAPKKSAADFGLHAFVADYVRVPDTAPTLLLSGLSLLGLAVWSRRR